MRLTALLCLLSCPALCQDHYRALVIGIERYATKPLPWAAAGAHDVAKRLSELGFEVSSVQNARKREFTSALDQFRQSVQPGDVVIFYYAGRATRSGDAASLVPIDDSNAVDLRAILRSLEQTHPAATLAALDVLAEQPVFGFAISSKWLQSLPSPGSGAVLLASTRSSSRSHTLTQELLNALRKPNQLAAIVRQVDKALSSEGPPTIYNQLSPILTGLERDRIMGAAPPGISVGADPRYASTQANTASNAAGADPAGSEPRVSPPPDSTAHQQPSIPVSVDPGATPPAAAPLQRYPTIDSPATVATGARFSVLVSLTIDKITPDVAVRSVGQGVEKTAQGGLVLNLPCQPKCEMEVVLTAPGFDFVSGSNTAAIQMTPDGDSTPARFDLTALQAGSGRLEATFWSHGAFLARAVRTIQVTPFSAARAMQAPIAPQAAAPLPRQVSVSQPSAPAALPLGTAAPDLTLQWEESTFAGQPQCNLLVSSPYLGPVRTARCVSGADLAKYLAQRYEQLHQLTGRGVQVPGEPNPQDRSKLVADHLRGLGRELYDHFATKAFQDAFWALVDKEKSDPNFHFRTIQIFTNNPVLPWEILVPARPDGSDVRGFLGVDFAVARWHIGDRIGDLPPLELPLRRVVAFAPKYQGPAYLAHQQEELQSISGLPGYERNPGNTQAMFHVLDDLPAGIVHFAGHGYARPAAGGAIFDYGLLFEDAAVSPTIWRGHEHPAARNHPLFILNACDTGEAQSVAGFVDGWAAAVLETGASGFIGGLWPLGDQGAAEFSKDFYAALQRDLGAGKPSSVAGLVRSIRAQFAKTSDPTFLAYVFYGDARLAIIP